MKNKCMRLDCDNDATDQVVFNVWAKVVPVSLRNKENSAMMCTSVVVCSACAPKVNVAEFMSDEGREIIKGAFKSMGKAEPDIDGAVVEFRAIGDKPFPTKVEDFMARMIEENPGIQQSDGGPEDVFDPTKFGRKH